MKTPLSFSKIQVKHSPVHGYGVFALEAISPNATIEECYLLTAHRLDPAFGNYYFEHGNQFYLPLGFGAIYNHRDQPNADFMFDPERKVMKVLALKSIQIGDEIFLSYGKDWFSSRKMQAKPLSFKSQCQALLSTKSFLGRFLIVLGALLLLRFLQQ